MQTDEPLTTRVPTTRGLMARGTAAFFAVAMIFGVAACGDDDTGTDEDLEIQEDLGDDMDPGVEEEVEE